MFRNRFYKDIFKAFLVICLILGLCRVTLGSAAALVAVLGVFFALLRKPGYMAVCYIMFPLFTIFNRTIVGLSPVFLMTARFGNLLMILAMLLTGAGFQGRAREHLPLGWMFVYCIVACFSSIDGWMPMISFLKIAQFILFILGLLMVGRVIQASDRGLYQLRCAFMAMAIIFILGSFAARFIPSVGYSMTFANAQAYGYEMTIEDFTLENYDPVKPQLQFDLGI